MRRTSWVCAVAALCSCSALIPDPAETGELEGRLEVVEQSEPLSQLVAGVGIQITSGKNDSVTVSVEFGGTGKSPMAARADHSHSSLQAEIAELSKRVDAIEQRAETTDERLGSVEETAASLYCGKTEDLPGDLGDTTGGYVLASQMCSAVSTCAPSAHVCSPEDILRSILANRVVPDGWAATAYYAETVNDRHPLGDCAGFTIGDSTHRGQRWATFPGDGEMTNNLCDTEWPLLCCN